MTRIPGGSSTGSKRPEALYGSAWREDAGLPIRAVRAHGCTIETDDGRSLLDLTMALGAVAFGYADPDVVAAMHDAARDGAVCGLPPVLEGEVAELLHDAMPSLERVRFLKTGAEATAAALRIARTATGRAHVIASGYFGWHDWCAAPETAGVPANARADVSFVPYDDIGALERAVESHRDALAAIVLEPLVHDYATAGWLHAAREACRATGAVLVFDEIKTACRVHRGGAQQVLGVTPDLTVLGKAIANGAPLAAVGGHAAVMDAAARTWISSTLASETTALAAARVVLQRHAREDVCGRLATIGESLRALLHHAFAAAPSSLGLDVVGPAPMLRVVARDPSDLDAFVAAAARQGVLVKRGAYSFAALAHEPQLPVIGAALVRAAASLRTPVNVA